MLEKGYNIKRMEKKKLLGTGISIGVYDVFTSDIIDLARRSEGDYICLANVHMVIEAYNDPEFSSIVNNAIMVAPDGRPLSLLLKILYNVKQPRVAGMDLLPDILKLAGEEKVPVFFYGSTSSTLDKVKAKLRSHYPEVILAGVISPVFGDISPTLLKSHIDVINGSKAGIIFVVFGCPKQEKLMAEMSGRVKGVMIGIGGAVPIFAGELKRAPEWMQKYSLEWFFRLLKEPGRLWKRYLFTNTKFILLVLRELFLRKILKKQDPV